MKKVLMVAGRMHYGGLENMLMNFYRYVDKTKISFDFMLNYEQPGVYDDEIRGYGGKIFIMPRLNPRNAFRYIRAVNRFFREHKGEYDIVHGHLTSVGVIYLTIAKLHGVKTRIIHAHYTDTNKNKFGKLERLMLFPLRFCADYFFACSDMAGAFCYGKKILKKPNYKKINNGIVLENFSYDPGVRAQVREELDIGGCFVVCHVGRFEPQKNHWFLLEAFRGVCEKEPSARLLLIGGGSLEEEIKNQARTYGIEGQVLFLGPRGDVPRLLQGADLFVLPSLFEGLPVVGVEAQAAGLPCIFSDKVTPEVKLTEQAEFLPIDDPSLWRDKILADKTLERKNTEEQLRNAGYDIWEQAKWLENFYLKH